MADIFDNIIHNISGKNAEYAREGDFEDERGVLICGKCGEPRQTLIEYPTGSGVMRAFPIICRCDREEDEAFRNRMARQRFEAQIGKLRKTGLTDEAYKAYTFQNDDLRNPRLSELCRRYVKHWEEMRANGTGLLFYGDTGGGKSFYACCIANALLDIGVPVLVTRLADLVRNRLDQTSITVKPADFSLIVLDDIGVENATATAFNIVDDIYRAGIPLIVTTNLAPQELKAPETLEQQRIYDRIIERCCITQLVPKTVSRLDTAKSRRDDALRILGT